MRILVTGGAGFIGSALIRHLIRHTSHTVLNLDKLSYAGNLDSLEAVVGNDRYHFGQVDIGDTDALTRQLAQFQPEAVMHLAAESHVDRSIDRPAPFIQTNIVGTYTLLEACRNYWSGLEPTRKAAFRLHHVSTDEVYGDLGDTGGLFTEATRYAPSSPYAASKAGSDHLVRAWHRSYGLPILISNSSNNFGPCQFPEKLIPHMILTALQGQPLPIYGDGAQVRDWLYVEDHARALLTVLTQGRVGETYNIGGGNERRNLDVVTAVCRLLDELVPGLRPYADLITFVQDRPGHDRRYAIDATKIQRELGWRPLETFESGLAKTVRWYLDNTQWWDRVLNGAYRLERMGNKA